MVLLSVFCLFFDWLISVLFVILVCSWLVNPSMFICTEPESVKYVMFDWMLSNVCFYLYMYIWADNLYFHNFTETVMHLSFAACAYIPYLMGFCIPARYSEQLYITRSSLFWNFWLSLLDEPSCLSYYSLTAFPM